VSVVVRVVVVACRESRKSPNDPKIDQTDLTSYTFRPIIVRRSIQSSPSSLERERDRRVREFERERDTAPTSNRRSHAYKELERVGERSANTLMIRDLQSNLCSAHREG
jgi:hypothetical protein